MSSLSNDEKEFNERDISKLERNRSSISQNLQPRQNKVYSQEQSIRIPDNTKYNIEKVADKVKTKILPNTNTVSYNYGQISESMMDISFDYVHLQKEFTDSFQSAWMQLLKSSLYNYRVFQGKMIDHYAGICKTHTKNMNSFGLERNKNS